MSTHPGLPSIVLICCEADRIDRHGLTAWLGYSLRLAGVVLLREKPGALLRRLRREQRRAGALRLADALLFRVWHWLRWGAADAAWQEGEVVHLQARYPADTSEVPVLVTADPNSAAAREFIRKLAPDLALVRSRTLPDAALLALPRHGSLVLRPCILPEYRSAHGCFWALANRDLDRVGMTLLRPEPGSDDGPVYLQASYPFDEQRESHVMIQYRVVLENLESITEVIRAVCRGSAEPLDLRGREAVDWGQPLLSAYWRWKRCAREALA